MSKPENPYTASATPTSSSNSSAQSGRWREILFVISWALLSGMYCGNHERMLHMFEEFEIQLPLTTRLVMSSVSLFVIPVLATTMVYSYMIAARSEHQHRARLLLTLFTIVVAAILALGFFSPLLSLLTNLS